MKEKKEYQIPEITVVTYSDTDIIATSVKSLNGFDGEVDTDW